MSEATHDALKRERATIEEHIKALKVMRAQMGVELLGLGQYIDHLCRAGDKAIAAIDRVLANGSKP